MDVCTAIEASSYTLEFVAYLRLNQHKPKSEPKMRRGNRSNSITNSIPNNSLQMSQAPQVRKSRKVSHAKHINVVVSCAYRNGLNRIHGVIKAHVPLVRNFSQVGLEIPQKTGSQGGQLRTGDMLTRGLTKVCECTLALQQFYFCRCGCRSVECHEENDSSGTLPLRDK